MDFHFVLYAKGGTNPIFGRWPRTIMQSSSDKASLKLQLHCSLLVWSWPKILLADDSWRRYMEKVASYAVTKLLIRLDSILSPTIH